MATQFTDNARQVMSRAEQMARERSHAYVGTEHLLLGLVQDECGIVTHALRALGVESQRVEEAIDQAVATGSGKLPTDSLPLTPRAKRAIAFAQEETWILQQDCIGPEHLVLGLLRESAGVAGQVLESLEVNLDELKNRVVEFRMDQIRFVEKIVRPVRADTACKRKMREELLAHLTTICDEELGRFRVPQDAINAAIQRFGNPTDLTRDLQSSLNWKERWRWLLERWIGWRPPESATRWMLRSAIQTLGLLAVMCLAAVGFAVGQFGWNSSVWLLMRPIVAISLIVPIVQFIVCTSYFKLRDTWFSVLGSRKSWRTIIAFELLIVAAVAFSGLAFTTYTQWAFVAGARSLAPYFGVGFVVAVGTLLIARSNGPVEIRDTMWACLDLQPGAPFHDPPGRLAQ